MRFSKIYCIRFLNISTKFDTIGSSKSQLRVSNRCLQSVPCIVATVATLSRGPLRNPSLRNVMDPFHLLPFVLYLSKSMLRNILLFQEVKDNAAGYIALLFLCRTASAEFFYVFSFLTPFPSSRSKNKLKTNMWHSSEHSGLQMTIVYKDQTLLARDSYRDFLVPKN